MDRKLVLFVKDEASLLDFKHDFLDKERYELIIVSGYEAGVEELSSRNYDLIICALNRSENQISLLEETKKRSLWIKTVSILTGYPLGDFLGKMTGHKLCSNIIGGKHPLELKELLTTVDKLFSKDIFGVEGYLSIPAKTVEIRISDSMEKPNCINEAMDFVEKFDHDQRLLRVIPDVVDELLMNALYDAPCNEKGEFLYAHLDRMERVVLKNGEQITLRCAYDGRYLAISACDPFGSLDRDKFMDYLIGRMAKPDGQVKIKPGGGGIGIYKILEYVSAFVVNLEPRKRTEVICIIDLKWPMREFQKRHKSFHIFTSEAEIKMAEGLFVNREDSEGALVVTFKGTIDEQAHLGRIFETDKNKIKINLKDVDRINSCGVREWVNAIKEITPQKQLEFVESSQAMVRQFNMIANFGGPGRQISFMAPYYCPKCKKRFDRLIMVDEHLEALLNCKAPAFTCIECGSKLEFDDLEDKYFQFILRQESLL